MGCWGLLTELEASPLKRSTLQCAVHFELLPNSPDGCKIHVMPYLHSYNCRGLTHQPLKCGPMYIQPQGTYVNPFWQPSLDPAIIETINHQARFLCS